MKGEDLQGAVGLWSFTNEEAYLADVRITPAAPQNLKNGSDVAGSWEMRYSGAPGPVNAFLAGWIDGDSGKGLDNTSRDWTRGRSSPRRPPQLGYDVSDPCREGPKNPPLAGGSVVVSRGACLSRQ